MDAKFCLRCGGALSGRAEAGRERPVCAACGWVYYGNPTPVVAALLEHEGEIVLVQNKGWPATWYGLVTGFLESGETPEAGLLREVEEELGLSAEIVSWIGCYSFEMRNEIILAWHVRATGEIRVGEELAGYKRVAPERLRPWPMGTGHAVRDWLARRA